ncbi:MAG: hypothetical protein KIT43_13120 [Bauldia sp.]|nr:hypothetical protein [Bauldia sp.]MCW5717039.1 hypothetical protein [Bauldia sp.]
MGLRAGVLRNTAGVVIALVVSAAIAGSVAAQGQQAGQTTGLPIPRFVSLAAAQVNVRNGPGSEYPIAWQFVRARYPVEVVNEYDNWRRIRDINGDMGWVLGTLLSAERTAIVRGEAGTTANLYAQPTTTSAVTYVLQAGVQASINQCNNGWCRLVDARFNGWIEQTLLWGTYPNERVE